MSGADWLSLREAVLTGGNHDAVRRWCLAGQLRAEKWAGRWNIPSTELPRVRELLDEEDGE